MKENEAKSEIASHECHPVMQYFNVLNFKFSVKMKRQPVDADYSGKW